MTSIELRPAHLLPREYNPHSEVGWWGMVLFCMTEGTLFAYFIGSYFYLGSDAGRFWPPAGIEDPTLPLPLSMTALLVSSSVVLWLAEKALERGRRAWYRAGTAAAIALGAGFLALQVMEYREKLKHFTAPQHAYASLFYTITGFHGTHVAFGLLMLLWALLREVTGRLDPERPLAVKTVSLYWHFVDGVWLVILTSLYLSPRFY